MWAVNDFYYLLWGFSQFLETLVLFFKACQISGHSWCESYSYQNWLFHLFCISSLQKSSLGSYYSFIRAINALRLSLVLQSTGAKTTSTGGSEQWTSAGSGEPNQSWSKVIRLNGERGWNMVRHFDSVETFFWLKRHVPHSSVGTGWGRCGGSLAKVLLPLFFMQELYIGAASEMPRLITRCDMYDIIN